MGAFRYSLKLRDRGDFGLSSFAVFVVVEIIVNGKVREKLRRNSVLVGNNCVIYETLWVPSVGILSSFAKRIYIGMHR